MGPQPAIQKNKKERGQLREERESDRDPPEQNTVSEVWPILERGCAFKGPRALDKVSGSHVADRLVGSGPTQLSPSEKP